MLYRVHKPHMPSGALGSFLGYIYLCPLSGWLQMQNALLQAKIITADWPYHNEVVFTPSLSEVPGAYTYDLFSARVMNKRFFFLIPLSRPKNQATYKDGYSSSATTAETFTTTIPINFQYIMQTIAFGQTHNQATIPANFTTGGVNYAATTQNHIMEYARRYHLNVLPPDAPED